MCMYTCKSYLNVNFNTIFSGMYIHTIHICVSVCVCVCLSQVGVGGQALQRATGLTHSHTDSSYLLHPFPIYHKYHGKSGDLIGSQHAIDQLRYQEQMPRYIRNSNAWLLLSETSRHLPLPIRYDKCIVEMLTVGTYSYKTAKIDPLFCNQSLKSG